MCAQPLSPDECLHSIRDGLRLLQTEGSPTVRYLLARSLKAQIRYYRALGHPDRPPEEQMVVQATDAHITAALRRHRAVRP